MTKQVKKNESRRKNEACISHSKNKSIMQKECRRLSLHERPRWEIEDVIDRHAKIMDGFIVKSYLAKKTCAITHWRWKKTLDL